ncbi:PAS domain-containing protein [Halogeometricum sp. S1BR25-6]|uniref:histidine kinase n=1 Tax=Halogeometricum salsisoli TaxID=2950536 RepID=A0ABU2GDB6_9EURY|nr:PAS domain-containing protein [Halogeometricum sp. S1BR25-6]MDS0298782.1 PAS domain-containing protein [Halogeometricum sp. S1BR25-6]
MDTTEMSAESECVRVLYVDGDAGRRDRFRTRFEADAAEHTLRTADTAEAALSALASTGPPSCLVAAPSLPDGDGLDLLLDARRRWEELPVVLTVVEGSDELARDAVDAGVSAYLPVRSEEEVGALVSRTVALGGATRLPSAYVTPGAFLQDAVDALDDVFYVFDAEFRLARWNRRLSELFDLTDEELRGMRPTEFFLEADRPAVERAAAAAVREGETTVEARGETTEGLVLFELTGRRLTAPDGSLVGLCGVGRDVTDQRRRERQLRQQNERLEEFANVVTHDLRNPLAVSTGFLDLERAGNDSSNLGRVAEALDRMNAIVDDVLRTARDGLVVEDPEPVSLAAVARAAWATVETDAATLRVETDRTVLADEEYLRRLFENLFRNSVEHGSTSSRATPDDSVEHSSTSSRTQSGDTVEHGSADGPRSGDVGAVTVTVGALPGGFFVADDGPGVAEAVRGTLFDSGVSTAAGGTGFGLHIVRSLAGAHGWEVALADVGAGARFEFRNVSVCHDDAGEESERERERRADGVGR